MKQAIFALMISLTVICNVLAERTINQDENWSGKVVLDETVIIKQATVTVAPGTKISVSSGNGIRIGYAGSLVAIGTEQAPIQMTGSTNAAIKLEGGSLQFEQCELKDWQQSGQHKNQSSSISGSVKDKGAKLVRCSLERCGTIRLSINGPFELRDCDLRDSGGVSLNGKGAVTIIGNTLRGGSISATRMPSAVSIRDNVVVGGGISAFGCPEATIAGNYVHKPTPDGGIGLHFSDGEMRDNVLRGGSWTVGQITGMIAGNLFISLLPNDQANLQKFVGANTHEHVFGLAADAVVERNIFIGPSYGALMGIGGNNMSNSVIRHNTFDLHGHGYAVYMNHLVKSKPKDVEVYNNIFMRCEGVNDESSYLDSATFIDHNLWADAGKDKDGRFRKVRMTDKVPGDDGFGGNGIPPFGSAKTLAITDVAVNPDVSFPFTDEEMLTRKHTVSEVLTVYRNAYKPKAGSAAVNAGIVRGANDAAVTDGKPDIGAIEL